MYFLYDDFKTPYHLSSLFVDTCYRISSFEKMLAALLIKLTFAFISKNRKFLSLILNFFFGELDVQRIIKRKRDTYFLC